MILEQLRRDATDRGFKKIPVLPLVLSLVQFAEGKCDFDAVVKRFPYIDTGDLEFLCDAARRRIEEGENVTELYFNLMVKMMSVEYGYSRDLQI